MPTNPKDTKTPSPMHTPPTNPRSGPTVRYLTRFPAPTPLPRGTHGHLRGPPRPNPNFSALSLSPPETATLGLVSLLHILPHTHPPHFLALASLPAPDALSPTSPRSPHTPKPLHPPQQAPRLRPRGPARARGAGAPSPAPHAGPEPGHVQGSLCERGLRRTTPDPRSVSCSPPPERWGAESPLGFPRDPGFPSTNSSARALPSPPPTYLAAEGPPSLSSPSSLRPPALPPATHQRGPAASGGGAEGGGKEEAVRAIASSKTVRVARPLAYRCPELSSGVDDRSQRFG
ncbi:PREDICTED: formin-like protein 3 [Ceratotherium simum simum]|uniref:Formin-like protein 3 n=1 Tax=Ceratotherium simum simum TaxID=73337 RepID=A0ABM1CHI3_CERSS|nr:PREDICTED: formin-like protein 3 [Ceratotherium simum simum]